MPARARRVARDPVLAAFVGVVTYLVADHRVPLSPARFVAIPVVVVAVLLVGRRPVAAICAIVVILPVQQTLLAYLWHEGLSTSAAREAGFLKDVLLGGLVVGALRLPAAVRRPLTAVDKIFGAYVVVVGLYYVLPFLSPTLLGGQTPYLRLAAARIEAEYIVLFLVIRRFRFVRADVRKVENALLVVAAVVAVFGLYELINPLAYDRFMVRTIAQPRFVQQVLGDTGQPSDALITGGQSGTSFYRNGGIFLDALLNGFFLVAPMTIGLRRLVRERTHLPTLAVTGACAAVLVNTLTRSAILGGVVAAVIVLLTTVRARRPRSIIIVGVAIGIVMIFAPLAGGGTLLERISGATNGADASTKVHGERSSHALEVFLRTPLGLGLGSNPATGQDKGSTNSVTAEDAYLQVGLELGWAGLLLFALGVIATGVELFGLTRRGPPEAIAIFAAGVGLTVTGFFLHVWLSFQTSWVVWGLAAVVCAAAADRPIRSPDGGAERKVRSDPADSAPRSRPALLR